MASQNEVPSISSDSSAEPAAPPTAVRTVEKPGPESELVLEDLLVEDVSIDGMCGVY